ncbi:variant erythrocyte surface antigen-1 beta subunit [Babesia bovis T2Bo]|uniref:variant erythrocyte surface antigen-1 beta subunit n=1 Tax=Babesia bovis T2Bo TaxID=484906 RepID=UPI001DF0772C|nr:variant erythrocyte surface antigen-1 beta subunit [Babesia bovis T2Bo]EDO06928.2 variant erythrocyte surface antigen-1 beta subunit [Babesia bovis T2Bo]
MAAAAASPWPYDSLTQAPTNLKEAIDWVLRVTGRDGKQNVAKKPPSTDNPPHCLCYLAKATKDLLYDARSPGSPGPSPKRYWDGILLQEESAIVKPVLTDLGLVYSDSTGAASSTCAGGTEVIKALIDQLALGLQKWVGWQEKGDECCLKGENGIGKKCDCPNGGGGTCCTGSGTSSTPCHQCSQCGTTSASKKCYLSAYCKTKSSSSSGTTEHFLWTSISSDSTKVHLLARIFLGSVCLIWSGLSQLGFLTGKGSSRWENSSLHSLEAGDNKGLGSFMAAMGYDLERLNGSGTVPGNKNGEFVHDLLTDKSKGVPWKEFQGDSTSKESVAEYYSSIYSGALGAAKGSTEDICTKYPLLVLHILASGYFRAGSAGAKGITPKAGSSTAKDTTNKDTPSPRKPRTIREILYWLSALPYSQGYKDLVDRMGGKFPEDEQKKGELKLHGESNASTTLKRDCITHYLLAACGYCPLVLIGIQGTIEKEVDKAQPQPAQAPGSAPAAAEKNRCPEHSKDPKSKRCTLEEIKKKKEEAAKAKAAQVQLQQQQQQQQQAVANELTEGQVCYGGYHLDVSQFGPLHGMYANGLFGFQMDLSAAQCLDQLRVYVYHCFYQLYFLRKQCTVGVAGDKKAVLGWQSCRYGNGVYWGSGASNSYSWLCKAEGASGDDHTKKCGLQSGAGGQKHSPLMCFLCDGLGNIACPRTVGRGNIDEYPSIEDHMNTKYDFPPGHLKMPQGHCPVPMGWSTDGRNTTGETHFKDLTQGTHKTENLSPPAQGTNNKYPAHCTGRTLSLLLEYYCDPEKCHGTLVVLLRLLACITPTVPRTLGDLFGFYYYIVYIGGNSSGGGGQQGVYMKLEKELRDVRLSMLGGGPDGVVKALEKWKNGGDCSTTNDTLKCLVDCTTGTGAKYLSPLSGQQYGQLSPLMAGTYLSWLVYLIEGFRTGLEGLKDDYMKVDCKGDGCTGKAGAVGCGESCKAGSHGMPCSGGGSNGVCQCTSVVSCTGVLPVLYKYGFGYGNVTELHSTKGTHKKCHNFLGTLESVLKGEHLKKDSNTGLHHEINQLIYTTRLPWIFVLTLAWLVAVLYLAFGAIWPLDWTHMRSHCRGWFRKGSLSPWEILMVGKKKGRGILEFFGKT